MADLFPHDYIVDSVPPGCTKYVKDSPVTMYVEEPPPEQITLHLEGPCDGVMLMLVEDE